MMSLLGAQLAVHFFAVLKGNDQIIWGAPEVLADALAVICN
jgi:hypothetical protein